MISVDIEKLTSETKYNFYAVLESELGDSSISRISFETIDLSRGILMKLTFGDIVENLDIVKSLERIMRISPLRIKVLTSKSDLQAIKNNVNQYKNQPKYIYEVVIAPDPTNDTTTPKNIVEDFISNTNSKTLFLTYMPDWNSAARIPYRELRPVKPILTVMPKTKTINFYNATFTLKMWERTNIYAVMIETLDSAEDSYDIAS